MIRSREFVDGCRLRPARDDQLHRAGRANLPLQLTRGILPAERVRRREARVPQMPVPNLLSEIHGGELIGGYQLSREMDRPVVLVFSRTRAAINIENKFAVDDHRSLQPHARVDTTPEPGMANAMAQMLLATGMAWAVTVPPVPPTPEVPTSVAGDGMVVGADEFGGFVIDAGAMYYPAGGLPIPQMSLEKVAQRYKEDTELILILQLIRNKQRRQNEERIEG